MFDVNATDGCSAVSPLGVCLQPLNPRQAMVKRLSVVNLENFRRQYARRRWKVKRMDFSLLYDHKTCRNSFHFLFFFLQPTAVVQDCCSVQPPDADHEEGPQAA